MSRRRLIAACGATALLCVTACGDSGSGSVSVGGVDVPNSQSPSSVTAEDLYGHWSVNPTTMDGDYGYVSFMRVDPEYGLEDGFLLAHQGSDEISRGTFTVSGGVVHLTTLTSTVPTDHTIDAFNGETLALTGPWSGTETIFTRRERCHAPGDWHSVGEGYRYGSFDVHGDLHMTGPAGTLSTRSDLCGAWPLVDIPAGHDVLGDSVGAVWVVQLHEDLGLLVYGFDPLSPETSLRMHVVDTENVGAPGIHTELYLATRPGAGGDPTDPTGLLVVGVEGRTIWEHLDGTWQRIHQSDDNSLADLDTEVFFDGDGRLHVSSGAQVIRETAPESRTMEVWDVAAGGAPLSGSVNQGIRYAFDAEGRLHTIFAERPPPDRPDNPNLVAEGNYVMVHGVLQDDDTWATTPLTGGLALDMKFGEDGRLHIGLLETSGPAFVAHLDADMGPDGRPTAWRTRLAPASLETVGVHAAQYNRAFPIGRLGPGGSYFLSWQNSVHASPDFQAWHFGHEGAPTWPMALTIDEDDDAPGGAASITIPEIGATCEEDCTLELEVGRVYRHELGGEDMQSILSPTGAQQWRWDWGWFRSWVDTYVVLPTSYEVVVRVERSRVLSAEPFLELDAPIMQTGADLDIRADGKHVVTWHGHTACGNGSSTTDVSFTVRDPDAGTSDSVCVTSHSVFDTGLLADDGIVALALTSTAVAPEYGGTAEMAGTAWGDAFMRVDGDLLTVTDGHFLAGYEDMANLAVSGTRVAAFGRHAATGEGHLVRWDTAAPETLLAPVVLPTLPFEHVDTRDGWVGAFDGSWYALGDDALVAIDDATGSVVWSVPIPTGRQLAVGPDGTLHVFTTPPLQGSPPDFGGGPIEGSSTGFAHARFDRDGVHLSSRYATGGLSDAHLPLADGGVMLSAVGKFDVRTWVIDSDADRWYRSWGVEIGGLAGVAGGMPHLGAAALAAGPDGRVWGVHAQTNTAWIDYDKHRVHAEEFTQLVAVEYEPW